MGKYFVQDTPHAKFERMMQEIPRFDHGYPDWSRCGYLRQLEKVVSELELEQARKRIEKAVCTYFGDGDDLFFRSCSHRKKFYSFYQRAEANKWASIRKNHYIATVYLLFSDDFFTRFLPAVLDRNIIKLSRVAIQKTDEDIYDLYKAAQFLCDGEDNLKHEDFIRPGVLNERVMALIINAFIINKYGVKALMPDSAQNNHRKVGGIAVV